MKRITPHLWATALSVSCAVTLFAGPVFAEEGAQGWQDSLNAFFGAYVVAPLVKVLFFDVAFWDNGSGDSVQIPFIVAWLVLGASFFTLRFSFVNIRAFGHALAVTVGRYDRGEAEGEVSHFKALTSALSGTVGLGNIAGVAVAVHQGGPGAVFWMMVAAFLGMSSKFAECTLGVMFRDVGDGGRVLGGPMSYLRKGLATLKLSRLGRVLALVFAVMCLGGSLGGGNMFQANQSYAQMQVLIPGLETTTGGWVYGVVIALLVGVVILGNIKRIGAVASFLTPIMCAIYLIAGVIIIVANAGELARATGVILGEAFTLRAGWGGLVGVLLVGFKRAAFSNEAGIGSAAIAYSAANTDEPVREGIIALLEPFIDTIIVCTMTGLVVVVTGAYLEEGNGIVMTSRAFASVLPWFPKVLCLAVFLFAVSTMITWSYYGERCWVFLFGQRGSNVYKVIFLVFVVLGVQLNLENVITFSDLMVLGMALPNIIGVVLLSGTVRRALDDYWRRLKSGEMKPRTTSFF